MPPTKPSYASVFVMKEAVIIDITMKEIDNHAAVLLVIRLLDSC